LLFTKPDQTTTSVELGALLKGMHSRTLTSEPPSGQWLIQLGVIPKPESSQGFMQIGNPIWYFEVTGRRKPSTASDLTPVLITLVIVGLIATGVLVARRHARKGKKMRPRKTG